MAKQPTPTSWTGGNLPAQTGEYRIRWANVSHGNGHRLSRERMCVAERKTRWFGWWPVIDAEWRFDEDRAHADIERDRRLREPLPMPRVIA